MTGWRKSSHCSGADQCVWVDIDVHTGDVSMSAGTGTSPVLTFTRDEWAAFVAGVKAGDTADVPAEVARDLVAQGVAVLAAKPAPQNTKE